MNDKERVRQDIKSYEGNKRLKRLSTLGAIGSAGTMVIGGYKKSKPLLSGGAAGAFLSGFLRGHSKREEKASLNRIKKFYDLREKTAVLGGAVEAASAIAGTVIPVLQGGMGHAVALGLEPMLGATGAQVAGGMMPLAMDLLALPTIADYVGGQTRKHMYVAAKDIVKGNESLTPTERIYRAKSQKGVAAKEITKNLPKMDPRKPLYNWWNRVWHSYKATGGQFGEYAGKAIKELNKYSPTLADSALGALKDDKGLKRFERQLKLRGARYQQAANILDKTIDEVPGLRQVIRATGRSGQSFISDILENPRVAKEMAEKIRSTTVKGVRAGKAGLIGLGLAGAGALAGSYRKRHPLAKDELPGQLAYKKAANILTPPINTRNVNPTPPIIPPQPAPANVGTPQ